MTTTNLEGKGIEAATSVPMAPGQNQSSGKADDELQTILRTTLSGFWSVGPQGRFLEVNQQYCKMIGYRREELLEMSISDIEVVEDPGEVERHIGAIVKAGSDRFETRHRRRDGEIIDVEVSATHLPATGNFFVFIREITARRRAEEALRRSETKYRTLVEQIPQAIFQKDTQGVYVSCNERYARTLGVAAADLPGKTDLDFFPRHLAEKYRADDRRVMETRGTLQVEEEYIAHGQPRTILTSKTAVIGETGEVIGVLGVFTDITERKLAEDRLRVLSSAVEQSPVSIVITDPRGTIEYANPKTCEATGYSIDELVGKNPRILKSGETTQDEYRRLWQTVPHGEWRGVFHNRKKNGQLFWEAATIGPVRDEAGEIKHFLAVKEDITARIDVEAALRESMERFRIAAESTSDVIYDWDLESGTAEIFGDAARLFGGYGEEYPRTYEDFLRLVHPDDRGRVAGELEQHIESGKHYQTEYRVVLRNGETRYWADHGRPILDASGKARRWIGANTDVTKRKVSETALAAEAVRRRILFEQSKDGVVILDGSGRACEANLSFANMLGYTLEELNRLHVWDWDAALRQDQIEELMREVRRTPATFETVVRRKDGSLVDVEISSSAADLDGGTFFYAVCRDISGRKAAEAALRESEERFRLIAETITEVFWVAVPDNAKVLYISPAYERVWGRSCASLYENSRSWFDAIHPDDQARVHDNLQVQKLGLPYEEEYRIIRPDGTLRWIWDRGFPIRAGSEPIDRYVGVAVDITDRKELERQLTQSQKLESIGQLAAGVAHEINTPIQYIGDNGRFLDDAFRDLLRAIPRQQTGSAGAVEVAGGTDSSAEGIDVEYLREEIPKAITQLLEGAEQVARIVRAMKEFSHPGPAEKTPLDINRAIRSTALVSRNEWKYFADLTTDLDQRLPPVPCVAGEFNQVILNLIVNAAQAVEEVVKQSGKKGSIEVSTRRAGEWAEIRVADTGCGIPEAIRNRIFDPFFTTKQVGKGTGQGLAIAHAVVAQKHQGTISFESEIGVGTTFVIRLPLETTYGGCEENPLRG